MKIPKNARKKLWSRKATAHKGDFGRVFILAGSVGYTGAVHLAGQGALRSGAGLITLGVPQKIYSIVARRQAEVMTRPFPSTKQGSLAFKALRPIRQFLKSQTVLAIGPGLSQNRETQQLIRKLISGAKIPMVIDADGLNALKNHAALLKKCRGDVILTPHPGEFCRLFGGKLSDKDTDRKKRAKEIAKKHRITVVLKGYRTVIASPSGNVVLNKSGNPGMASGGMGDVLTGIIASLLGQCFSVNEAACLGVYLHGLAGDLAGKKTGQASLTAGDVLDALPAAIRRTCA